MPDNNSEKIIELEAQIMQLKEEISEHKKEIRRLKSKYEERCWCSVEIPPRCGHKEN